MDIQKAKMQNIKYSRTFITVITGSSGWEFKKEKTKKY